MRTTEPMMQHSIVGEIAYSSGNGHTPNLQQRSVGDVAANDDSMTPTLHHCSIGESAHTALLPTMRCCIVGKRCMLTTPACSAALHRRRTASHAYKQIDKS